MQLVFPTNFGSDQFYTIINLKNVQIDSVEIVDNKKKIFNSSAPDTFIMENTPLNKEFSINDLNVSFLKENYKINNSIDNYLLSKIENK